MSGETAYTIHATLTKYVLTNAASDDDGLTLMLLLHSHRIVFRHPVLVDRPTITQMDAITQRHAADVVATNWPIRGNDKCHYVYWYFLFNNRTPYEGVEDMPDEWKERVNQIRELVAYHPWVEAIVPDE